MKTTINWIPVKPGFQLPEPSDKAFNFTKIKGCSDRVLVFCSDGEIRFARYYKIISDWAVEGCGGKRDGFVVYWSVNTTEEAEKLIDIEKLRAELQKADKELNKSSS